MNLKIFRLPLVLPFDDEAVEILCRRYFEDYPCFFCKSTNSELIVSDNPSMKSKAVGMYCIDCRLSESIGEISLRVEDQDQIEIRIWKKLPDGGPDNRWDEL